jgi:hypothetical protein
MGLRERIVDAVQANAGLTDRQLTDAVVGPAAPPQAVNQAARALANAGVIVRERRPDGRIGNYPGDAKILQRVTPDSVLPDATDSMTEDQVKAAVAEWLQGGGWTVTVRWGHERGIDIEAFRDGRRWIIEAKGCGSRQPMRVNYFIAMLGETLQRMNDPHASYSIALPDMPQYRGLWERLPRLAKERTTITMIFVREDGSISHLE